MTLAFAPCGTFRGSTQDVDGATVHRFLGIPYAGSPAGDRRFRPPVPVAGHSGDMDATSDGPAAPQNPDAAAPPGDEPYRWSEAGCLNLNIWTPDLDGPPRPVMVWIHGGAYLMGANSDGTYDGANLAATTGTVVVAINYRLGALGFLHLAHLLGEGFEDSSNLALLDQLEALRWVRGNISKPSAATRTTSRCSASPQVRRPSAPCWACRRRRVSSGGPSCKAAPRSASGRRRHRPG